MGANGAAKAFNRVCRRRVAARRIPSLILQGSAEGFKVIDRRRSPTEFVHTASIEETVNQCRLRIPALLKRHVAKAAVAVLPPLARPARGLWDKGRAYE